MITKKTLQKMRADIANIGTGAKKELAETLELAPSAVTRYLKYGDIPKDKLDIINKFIKMKLKSVNA